MAIFGWWENRIAAMFPLWKTRTLRGRSIVVTGNPELHLVWYYDRVFIKAIPEYILSATFWQHYLSGISCVSLSSILHHQYSQPSAVDCGCCNIAKARLDAQDPQGHGAHICAIQNQPFLLESALGYSRQEVGDDKDRSLGCASPQ